MGAQIFRAPVNIVAVPDMKILYIANVRMPTEKAHGAQIMKMCEAFVREGHEVTLIVPRRANTIKQDPFAYYGIVPLFSIVRIPCPDPIRFGKLGYFLQVLVFSCKAALLARKCAPDILYTRDAPVIAFGGLFGVRKLIWEAHTAAWNVLTGIAARNAQKIVAISHGLARSIEAHGISRGKILVAHDAVDLQDFDETENKAVLRKRLGLPLERRIIEYVGKFKTMSSPKGVEEIIEMAGVLSRTQPGIFLLLVGLNEDEFGVASDVARRAGLAADAYIFSGHVPRKEVPHYLRAADILIMNYPNTPHYADIMSPLKLFEYMASGVPIVSSDLPSLREVLDDSMALFVPPDDTKALAEGVGELLGDPARAGSFARAAQEEVKKYSWTARAKAILEFLTRR